VDKSTVHNQTEGEKEMGIWEELVRQEVKELPLCFACGKDSPIGLHLKFCKEDDKAVAEFTASEMYQGWPNIIHGGITCTMLDEAIGYAITYLGFYAMTTKLEVHYRKPAPVGKRLLISAWVKSHSQRTVEGAGEIRLEDGTIIAEGVATMHIIKIV
jgi:acyl-coenzyme A thioesterase PaaI-like protein